MIPKKEYTKLTSLTDVRLWLEGDCNSHLNFHFKSLSIIYLIFNLYIYELFWLFVYSNAIRSPLTLTLGKLYKNAVTITDYCWFGTSFQ